jgi:hypothetical protein
MAHKPEKSIGSLPPRQAVVGLGRFELPTSRLSGVRSNQLSYRPVHRLKAHFQYEVS